MRNSRLKKHSCSWAKDVKPCEDDDENYDMIMICKLLNRDDSCIDKLTRPRPCSSPKSKPIIPKSQECLKGVLTVLSPGGQ